MRVTVAEPDPPSFGTDGTYDALALVDSPSFVGPFSVSFAWLGLAGTAPGSQIFHVYNLDTIGLPHPIEVGVTTPHRRTSVPEPSTLLLAAAGTVVEWLRRRWRGGAST